jgi:protein-tyrosine sulfotransferase
MSKSSATEPIFIHGITPRSGTNFLWDLLCAHPDCAPARAPVREDLFMAHSDYLVAFSQAVQAAWDPAWGKPDDDLPARLHAALGDGLIDFLQTDRTRRLVTKSPSVRHIDRFFAFFPRARMLILVRDGRDVVSSCVRTFGWDFDRATRLWASGAEEIHRFDLAANAGARLRYRIVRYEDLLNDLRGTFEPILAFLDLEPATFDFAAAERLPVRGSSTHLGQSERVHWNPVEKSAEFNPIERWRAWGRADHQRFAWLGGRQLGYFGYPPSAYPVAGGGPALAHTVRDWIWHGATSSRRIGNGMIRRLFRAQRRLRPPGGRSA